MGRYLTAFFAGIGIGGMYALVALTYNLVYSSTGVFNFAQGPLLTLGGLLTYSLTVTHHVSVLAAVLPVVIAVGLVGLLQERLTVAPFVGPGKSSFAWVITTLGAAVILENLFQLIWGSEPHPVSSYLTAAPIRIVGSPLTLTTIIILVVAVLCVLGLEFGSRRTLFGRAWRATAQDPEAASVRGINVGRVGAISFLVAGGLSGLSGLVIAPVAPMVFSSGSLLSLQAFVALVIGGFGSAEGALAGGLILGVAQAEAALIIAPAYGNVVTVVLLMSVLMAKPSGLFGVQREREV